MKSRKIGIMGGTFNPIHYAHLLLAENAREQFGLDRIIFIPSGQSYMKEDEDIPSGEFRYQMVKMAIQGNPYFTCSRVEIDRPGRTYTVDTLHQLQRMYPGDELFFIMGADSLLSMESWYQFEDIFQMAAILVAVRDDTDERALSDAAERMKTRYLADIRMVMTGRMDISSTMIREKIKTGKSVRYLLPEDCVEYICLKNLYSQQQEERV
ncbi:MAG: nicotinate-nucleotide adenylyltransferase [Butyrivibrio sp.]|nr:nicotinate-nucleotide adenylyltransferase [Butyrivibrio sp.]